MKINVSIEKEYIKCPVCNGVGKIEEVHSDIKIKHAIVIKLFNEGYTHRKIMKLTGYKSTNSISDILIKNKMKLEGEKEMTDEKNNIGGYLDKKEKARICMNCVFYRKIPAPACEKNLMLSSKENLFCFSMSLDS